MSKKNAPLVKSVFIIVLFLESIVATCQKISPSPLNNIERKTGIGKFPGESSTDPMLNLLRKNPAFRAKEESINQQILSVSGSLGDTSFILPVVFHIINPNPNGIVDAQVIAILKDLNDAFGKRGVYAASKGVDTKIQFCLARKDPDGGNTTGITRTNSFFGTDLTKEMEDEKLKNLNRWDPSRYINIWLVTNITGTANNLYFSCGVWRRSGGTESAYATFPGTPPLLDGIVVAAINPGPLFAHEMGHYLGLYHTFEGSNCANSNCATEGDRVCDTPPDKSTNNSISCNNPENSCATDTLSNYSNGSFLNDVPDLIADFMDYGNDACHNEFTEGQAERMRAAIVTQRSGLLQNECDAPCPDNFVANFSRDRAQPVPGDVINFINTSTGASNFEWLINDAVVATSKNYSTSFSNPGNYKVTLKAYNGNSNCFASYTDFVIVTCGVFARFYPDKSVIASKSPIYIDSIYFTNNSVNAFSYKWMMSLNGAAEQVVGTSTNLNYIFLVPGNYVVRLIASNGGCIDTTLTYTVSVADPTQDGAIFFNKAECYQQTKSRVTIQLCNNGYATIPKNMPVSFYDSDPRNGNANKVGSTFFLPDSIPGYCCTSLYTFILDLTIPGISNIYAVFNDSGNTKPLILPGTSMQELTYTNNIAVSPNFQFKITIAPSSATLEPGDTLQLSTTYIPPQTTISSYSWSAAQNLNCTDCANPVYIAEKKISAFKKMLVTTSSLGCFDTSFVEIKIPPYDDFTIKINSVDCSRNDSLYVDFTICNIFKRGIIPKGLQVSFFDADPFTNNAHLLGPVFTTNAIINSNCDSYKFHIKGISSGKIYAAVNNNGKLIPLIFPYDSLYQEKNYSNDTSSFIYQEATVSLHPADTIIFRKESIPITINTTVYDAASTTWFAGNGYSLSCTNCPSPIVTVTANSVVTMQTANQYGCLIKGAAKINIFPPDMVVKILQTDCYTNNSTRVKFTICMNNAYDSIFNLLPVSFYDGNPLTGNAHLLQPIFYTQNKLPVACDTFLHIVNTPVSGNLYAVINDRGNNRSVIPDKAFEETNYINDTTSADAKPFIATVTPVDTSISRNSSVQLNALVTGGKVSFYLWNPIEFLSCPDCLTPVVTPPYSMKYKFIARNEYACIDTVYINIKTFSSGIVDIPNAFTPNNDGLNDIFYILGNKEIVTLKDFAIYTRWGEKVFQVLNAPSNDPAYGWNGFSKGIRAASGTYVYVVTILSRNGTLNQYKGNVILLR